MPVKGYNHMALQVSDLEAAERFYGDGLGLPKLPRPEFGIPGAWFQVGGDAMLHLVAMEGGPEGVRRLPHVALSVDLEQLRLMVDSAAAAGGTQVTPLAARTDTGTEVWSSTFADPDGNAVELTTAGLPS
jgi:catechol 2,3-dioxygenase-like lactoylglutathione lyase family enzyme